MLVVAATLAGGAPAHAESGRLNLHANMGLKLTAPLSFGVIGSAGLDWQLRPPFALDVTVGAGYPDRPDGATLVQAAAGLRFRFLDDQDGYGDELGGNQRGNLFLVPRIGYAYNTATDASFATVEAELGYEFSVARPLQIGPFARAGVAIGASGFGYFVAGINVSVELIPLPRPAEPEPAPAPDDDTGVPDTDEDGVPDAVDACPGTKLRSKVDARGCVVLEPQMVLEGITFEFDSAEIRPESEEALLRAAQSLRDNPGARVEIDGHTDDLGDDAYNLRLSEARARAVALWLVAHGIDEARLTVRGFGATRPQALNDTEAHRALNRRIEFRRLDSDAAPAQ